MEIYIYADWINSTDSMFVGTLRYSEIRGKEHLIPTKYMVFCILSFNYAISLSIIALLQSYKLDYAHAYQLPLQKQ